MKEVKPELSISKKGMHLVNNILAELFIKIMQEARNLMIFSKRQTLSSKEVESAIKLHFPGELMKLAIQTSRGSLQKFTTAEWPQTLLDDPSRQCSLLTWIAFLSLLPQDKLTSHLYKLSLIFKSYYIY